MPKHLKTILMYEDVDHFSLEREPDINLKQTIDPKHIEKMANGLIKSGYHNSNKNPAEKHQIYIRHLNDLEEDSEVLIGGVDSREKKLKKLLDDHYASRGMGNFKIKHHAQQKISDEKLKEIGKNIENGNGTIRYHADENDVTRRHLAELLRKRLGVKGSQQRPPHPPEVIKTVMKHFNNGLSAREVANRTNEEHGTNLNRASAIGLRFRENKKNQNG